MNNILDIKKYSIADEFSENPTADFGIGVAKGLGQAGKSVMDFGSDLSHLTDNPLDAISGYTRSAVQGIPLEQAQKEVAGISNQRNLQEQQTSNKINEALKGTNSAQDAGIFAGELASWLVPQTKITKLAKPLGFAGRVGAEALGGAGTGALIGGDGKRVETALYGAGGGIAGEFIPPVLSGVKKIKLRDMMKRGKGKVKETTKDIEDIIVSKKTGKTVENQGVVDKVFSSSDDLLTEAEKRQLVKTNPEVYKKYKQVLKDSEKNFDNPTLHQQGIEDFKKIFKDYEMKVKETGNKIGAVKDKVIKEKVGDVSGVKAMVNNFLEKNNILADSKDIVTTGNSPLKGNKKQIRELLDIVDNVEQSKSMKDLILGMKQLDEKIVYGKSEDISSSIQSIAKKVRNEFKQIRDSKLSKGEVKLFDDYSKTIGLIQDFNKGNMENKISVMLNSFGSKRDFKIRGIAEELKRVTGQDVNEVAGIIDIFMKRLPSGNRNVSNLKHAIGDGVPLTKFGIVDKGAKITKGILQKMLSSDIIKEIDKAGLTLIKTK